MLLLVALWPTYAISQAHAQAKQETQPASDFSPRLPPGVRAISDLEYAKIGDRPLLLDLYLPEQAKAPLPLVVWIHGGAWLGGSKNDCPAVRLVPDGYAVASIEYRLSQMATFPAQIEDCKGAIRWLRAHAAKYDLDPKHVGAWGASAGGHLVALLGTSGDVADLEGTVGGNLDQSSRMQAVCDWFGPTDFTQIAAQSLAMSRLDHDAPDSPEARLIGGPIQTNKDKAARANPITYVTADDPPFLIMHGDQDNLVPIGQSELLLAALKEASVPATLHTVKGAGHGFASPELFQMVRQFFDRQLKADKTD
jgi:acetyl esterase/lipase